MKSQVWYVGVGFGDALRCASVILQKTDPEFPNICFVENYQPAGVDVLNNLTFIYHVIPCERDMWEKFPQECLRPLTEVAPYGSPLTLDKETFKVKSIPYDLPECFTVVQPSSSLYKNQSISPCDTQFPCVLVGSEQDKHLEWPSVLDLRGKLTVAESMWVVAMSENFIGVESWCATLGAMLGKHGIMYAYGNSIEVYGSRWKEAWPTIEMR